MRDSIVLLAACFFLLSVQAQIINEEILPHANDKQEITWEQVYQTEGGTCFALNSRGDIFAGTGGSEVLRSDNNGDTWERCQLPNYAKGIKSIAINSNDEIFLTSNYDAKFFRSTDNGDNWVQLHADSGDYFTCLDINSTNVIFLGTYHGVVRSIDNGNNLIQTGWNNYVEDLIISSNDYIFIETGFVVYRSADNGQIWTNASTGITNTAINAFAFNSYDHIFAGTAAPDGGVFISTNNGDNWAVTGYSFPNETDSVVTAIGISSANDIFIGTLGYGALCSTNNGDSWEKINSGLPIGSLIYSFIVNINGYILAGTSMGIFRSLEPVVSIEDITYDLPVSFSLSQNYPNPFNPSTTIEFSLSKSEVVELKVYNILGKEVSTLVSNKLNQGNHSYTFDGSNLASGVYYYQLVAGAYREVKKMILLQ